MREVWALTPLWAFAMTLARWWAPQRFCVTGQRLWPSQFNPTLRRVDDLDEAVSLGNDADARRSASPVSLHAAMTLRLLEFIATLCAGIFAGAALYVTLAE